MKDIADYFDEMAPIWDNAVIHNKKSIIENIKLSEIKEGDKVMDIGSGTGILIDYIRLFDKSGEITQIDVSQRMLNMARAKNYNDTNIRYVKADVENYDSNLKYNVILIYNTLPYIGNKVEFIYKLYSNNLEDEGAILIFHSQGLKAINMLHACGDKRVSSAELPDIDNLLMELKQMNIDIPYYKSTQNEYTLLLKAHREV